MKQHFIGHGLPETFVADTHALVDAFEKALRERDAAKVAQIAAHASAEKALLAGYAAVRKLDVVVANQYHGDAVTMAIWEQERRVERKTKTSACPPDGNLASAKAEAHVRCRLGRAEATSRNPGVSGPDGLAPWAAHRWCSPAERSRLVTSHVCGRTSCSSVRGRRL